MSPITHEPPLSRILVATDLSPGGAHALRRAVRLPLAAGAEIGLVHVLSDRMPSRLRGQARREARVRLDALVDDVDRRLAAGRSMIPEVRDGDAFVEIIRRARELRAELIVVGRHGESRLRDMLLGTTAERVIRNADTAVLVVGGRGLAPYARPLLATNLEDSTHEALALLERVIGSSSVEVEIVHSVHVPFEGFMSTSTSRSGVDDFRRQLAADAERKLARLVKRYAGEGLRLSPVVRLGDARAVLIREAARRSSDLLVVGSHARSGLAHALVGSVAEWVTRASPCDVLVARSEHVTFELP